MTLTRHNDTIQRLKTSCNHGHFVFQIDPVTPKVFYGYGLHCGVNSSSLYFVDQTGGTVNMYDTETKQFLTAQLRKCD